MFWTPWVMGVSLLLVFYSWRGCYGLTVMFFLELSLLHLRVRKKQRKTKAYIRAIATIMAVMMIVFKISIMLNLRNAKNNAKQQVTDWGQVCVTSSDTRRPLVTPVTSADACCSLAIAINNSNKPAARAPRWDWLAMSRAPTDTLHLAELVAHPVCRWL